MLRAFLYLKYATHRFASNSAFSGYSWNADTVRFPEGEAHVDVSLGQATGLARLPAADSSATVIAAENIVIRMSDS